MKVQRDKLRQYQKRISKLTDRETEIAKECLLRGQRPKALLALRRKKYQETLLAKTDAQLEQLQRLTSDVEFAAVQKDVMYGLQQGTAVLKQIHTEMGGIEQVEKLLEEGAEARAYQQEVSDMLGGQLNNQDEDEVEDELGRMEMEVEGRERDDVGTVPSLPPVPILPDFPGLSSVPRTEVQGKEGEEKAQKARARARVREQERKVAGPLLA